jgi:CRISPR-associated protein Cas1
MASEPAPRPKAFPPPVPAKASVRRQATLPDYLPARMLNEFVYCPRLFFYEWVEGVFRESGDTIEGALRHEKIRGRAEALAPALANDGEQEAERIHARSVTLSSDRLRLIATLDLVEGEGSVVTPIDYKRGAPRDGGEEAPQAWPADRVQVCVQALLLRDNGYTCNEAIVYYDATKQRVRVPIDETLESETLDFAAQARRLAEGGRIPSPLVDSPKCPRCSLVSTCLPDETAVAMGLPPEDPQQPELFADAAPAEERPLIQSGEAARRLIPARDDLRPLYVTGHGLSLGRSGAVLQVRDRKGVVQEARLHDISQVNVFGSVSVTAGAVQALCGSDKPVAYFSTGHWFYGMTTGMGLKNVFLRKDQFARAEDPPFCLALARDIVSTKVRNQRTLLQRNHVEPPAPALAQLKMFAARAQRAPDLESLLGVEGSAARVYFEQFRGMLKVEDDSELPTFDFLRRNRRPPRDPVNALLSFAYSLMVRDLTFACHIVGFDPFIGFYHQPRFGRPALALDLMEGFRPLVADSAVITAINTRMVTPDDFVRAGGAVALSSSGRKGFIRAYEQRMDTLVTHPLFGYRVSYRRILEIQVRLLARVVTGELAHYPGFETR